MLRLPIWLLPLSVAFSAGNAHARHRDREEFVAPYPAHVTITSDRVGAALEVVPTGATQVLAQCGNNCDFWAWPGPYTLYSTEPQLGVRREIDFRIRRSGGYLFHAGNDSTSNVGLGVGIGGAAVGFSGILMTLPFLVSLLCESSDCDNRSQRRLANIGLGFMFVGAVATPIGFTLFVENRTTLRLLPTLPYAAGKPRQGLHLGVVGVNGGLGLGSAVGF